MYYSGEKHLDTLRLVERDSEKGKEKKRVKKKNFHLIGTIL